MAILPTLDGKQQNILFNTMFPMNGQIPFKENAYSLDINGVHFLTYSSLHLTNKTASQTFEDQYKWLEQDLIQANKNRHLVPWIILLLPNEMECLDIKCEQDKRDYYIKRLILINFRFLGIFKFRIE